MPNMVLESPGVDQKPGPVSRSPLAGRVDTQPRKRVAFLFNAQRHQLLHGVTSAVALARDWDADVRILSPNAEHLTYARDLAERYSPGSPLRFEEIGSPLLNLICSALGWTVPPKLLTLLLASRGLSSYDAIVLPERTSTIMRWFGVKRPKLVHIDHGAGDRAVGFDRRIRKFDFVMMPGDKHKRRLFAEKLVSHGRSAVTGYPKFEAADLMRGDATPIFPRTRPVILYNPHFSASLGSWHRHGMEIVRGLAALSGFNLIVAPHVRLFDNPHRRTEGTEALAEIARLPNVYIDLGSDRSVDMTYTSLADIYVGDVSSQVYEFLRTPRPCLFVNSGRHRWQGDPNFAHWAFGPVIDSPNRIADAISDAIGSHPAYRNAQSRGFAETFDLPPGTSSGARVAEAIARSMELAPSRTAGGRP